jgi:hypothetical protein
MLSSTATAKSDADPTMAGEDNGVDYGLAPSSVARAMSDADSKTAGNYGLVLSSAAAATTTETDPQLS